MQHSLSFTPPPRRPLIALSSMYRPKWSGDKVGQFNRSAQEFENLAREWDFDLHICRQPVVTWEDAEKVRRELVALGVDFLLVQINSFSSGEQLLPLLDGGYRMGIWSIPEPSAIGRLPLNSYCGANHMNSVAVLYRQRQDIKWFHGQVADELFQRRFGVTLSALRGIKQLEGARIGLVGKPATGFQNIFIDPRRLEQRYGVRFYDHELTEVYSRAQSYSPDERQKVARELIESVTAVEHELQPLEKIGAIELALLEIARDNGYHGMAVRCWPDWQKEYNVAICTLMSRFNQYGLPMACEGDALGLLGMMLLNGIAQFPATLMDMTVFDPEDESVLLWHCGPTPLNFAGSEVPG
jgi:L-fucose isomerase-like protein